MSLGLRVNFASGCPDAPKTFIEKAVSSIKLSFILCPKKNKLGILVGMYFWVFYFVLLIYVSITLIPHILIDLAILYNNPLNWVDLFLFHSSFAKLI